MLKIMKIMNSDPHSICCRSEEKPHLYFGDTPALPFGQWYNVIIIPDSSLTLTPAFVVNAALLVSHKNWNLVSEDYGLCLHFSIKYIW